MASTYKYKTIGVLVMSCIISKTTNVMVSFIYDVTQLK